MEKLRQSVFTSVVSSVVYVLMSIIMPWHSILLNRIPYLSHFLNTLWFQVKGNDLLDAFQCTKISFMYSSITRLQDELNSFLCIYSVTDCVWLKVVITCLMLNGWSTTSQNTFSSYLYVTCEQMYMLTDVAKLSCNFFYPVAANSPKIQQCAAKTMENRHM